MTITKFDPPSLHPLPGGVHVTVAEGSRIIHLSGQTGVDADGKVVSNDHRGQFAQALRNVITALNAAGATLGDLVKLTFYVVDYSEAALGALFEAAVEVAGDELPTPASTLVGVAALWQPDLLVEIDAVAVL